MLRTCARGSLGAAFQDRADQVCGVSSWIKAVPPNTDLEWQLILTYVSGLGPSHDLML